VNVLLAKFTLLVFGLSSAVVANAQLPTTPALEPSSNAEHIQTAQKFLTAWGRGQWDDLRSVAADEVTVRIGERAYVIAPAAAKAEVKLVFPYRGLSTVRVEGKVKGITLEEIGLMVNGEQIRGAGTLTLQEDGAGYRVVGVSTGR
jgi:hypothetical protein